MPKGYSYESGTWWAICDVCGFKYKNYELQRRWDGLMVCSEDYELRHPQEFVRTRPDRISLPYTRVEPTEIQTTICTIAGRSSYVGHAIAGCSVVGLEPNIS